MEQTTEVAVQLFARPKGGVGHLLGLQSLGRDIRDQLHRWVSGPSLPAMTSQVFPRNRAG